MAYIKHLVDLDLNKNQLLNAVVQNLATAPASPNDGQIYWSTDSDTLYVWSEADEVWIDLGSDGITNLNYTAGVSNGVVTSSSGTNATIPLADGTNAGLISAAEKAVVGNQSGTNTGDNATNSQYSGLVSNVSTDLSEGTVSETAVNVNSSDGTNATLAQASTSRAGVMSKAKFDEVEANTSGVASNLSAIQSNDSDIATNVTAIALNTAKVSYPGDQDLSGIATNASNIATNVSDISSLESGQTVQNTAIALNTAKVSYPGDQDLSGIATNASAIATNASGIATNVSDITALETSQGVQDTAIALNTAKVSNVDETVTSIALASNILTYTDEDGTDTALDLSLYLDDSNLARLTSGSLNGSTGLATFTRDDLSTFTIDMSAFLDAITLNDTLTSTSTTEGLTANMGKELKDLIDGLVLSTGTNTGDEVSASTTVEGVIEIATNTEANAGTLTNRAITPANLKNVLGTTSSLSTTLTYSALIGNGTLTSIPVTHSIGNQFVQANVYEVADGLGKVECEIELTSTTITTFKFNVAPASNALRVVIIG
tara:strand:+ start:353 stop:1990 length:1638 start_codon:yes stop_codon:yes gene_type:complete